jgi:hypothetical protein
MNASRARSHASASRTSRGEIAPSATRDGPEDGEQNGDFAHGGYSCCYSASTTRRKQSI